MKKPQYIYNLRKLALVLVLALLIISPILVQMYKMAITTDPFILMAREIEAFELGGVDVLNVDEIASAPGTPPLQWLRVLASIEDYPAWTIRKEQENFKRHVIRIAQENDYDAIVVLIGWDYPAKTFRIQGAIMCPELRASACEWEYIAGAPVDPKYIKWPGIGKP